MSRHSAPDEAVLEIARKLIALLPPDGGHLRRKTNAALSTIEDCEAFNGWVRNRSRQRKAWTDLQTWDLVQEAILASTTNPLLVASSHLLALRGPYTPKMRLNWGPGQPLTLGELAKTSIVENEQDFDTHYRSNSLLRRDYVFQWTNQGNAVRPTPYLIRERHKNGRTTLSPTLRLVTNAVISAVTEVMDAYDNAGWPHAIPAAGDQSLTSPIRHLHSLRSLVNQVDAPAGFWDARSHETIEELVRVVQSVIGLVARVWSRRKLVLLAGAASSLDLKSLALRRAVVDFLEDDKNLLEIFDKVVTLVTCLLRLEGSYDGRVLLRWLGPEYGAFFDEWCHLAYSGAEILRVRLDEARKPWSDETLDMILSFWVFDFENVRRATDTPDLLRLRSEDWSHRARDIDPLVGFYCRLLEVFPLETPSVDGVSRMCDYYLSNLVEKILRSSSLSISVIERATSRSSSQGRTLWEINEPLWTQGGGAQWFDLNNRNTGMPWDLHL